MVIKNTSQNFEILRPYMKIWISGCLLKVGRSINLGYHCDNSLELSSRCCLWKRHTPCSLTQFPSLSVVLYSAYFINSSVYITCLAPIGILGRENSINKSLEKRNVWGSVFLNVASNGRVCLSVTNLCGQNKDIILCNFSCGGGRI